MSEENKDKTIAEVKQTLLNYVSNGNDTAARDYKWYLSPQRRYDKIQERFSIESKPKIVNPVSKKAMTLCIAVIGENGTATIGLSDRMLTIGDWIEYEPRARKVFPITEAIFISIAGDIALGFEAVELVKQEVVSTPKEGWLVAEIAHLFHQKVALIPSENNLELVLPIFGITLETYKTLPHSIPVPILDAIAQKLAEFSVDTPRVDALIAGNDKTGANIYKRCKNKVTCENLPGYATIGTGSWLAESEMARMRYGKHVGIAQAAFLCYAARHAVAHSSGVGKIFTDIIFTAENHLAFIEGDLFAEMDKRYHAMMKDEFDLQVEHFTSWYEYIKSFEKEIAINGKNGEDKESTPTN